MLAVSFETINQEIAPHAGARIEIQTNHSENNEIEIAPHAGA